MTKAENFPAVLGWSNPDTGPASLRLYATDRGDSPRWARPRARVIEDALMEAGSTEGDRYIVTRLGDRFVSPEPPEDPLRVLLGDEDQALGLIRRAIADPAQFLPRAGYGTPEAEAVTSWGARAVLAALREVAGNG